MKNNSKDLKIVYKQVNNKPQTPPRVAPRLEGVVKNVGIKPKKKEPTKR